MSVKALHKALMQDYSIEQGVSDPAFPLGDYKQEINGTWKIVEGKRMYKEYLPPPLVPHEMDKLIEPVNHGLNILNPSDSVIHPVLLASYFHWKFLEIHPFFDGNGRLARIFSNLILMKSGFPAVVIK